MKDGEVPHQPFDLQREGDIVVFVGIVSANILSLLLYVGIN